MKKLYPEYSVYPKTEEMNNTFAKLASLQRDIQNANTDNCKEHVVLLHDLIRSRFGWENKIFLFAFCNDDGYTHVLFFNKKPDGSVYYPKEDENGMPYLEVEGEE